MEGLTRAVWDFMDGAYEKGVLDELLSLVGALSDPEADLGEQLGNLEDRLSDADFARFEETSTEVLTPLLQALAEDEVLESLQVLLTTWRPLFDAAVERAGGDTDVVRETLGLIQQNLISLKTVAVALMPVLAKIYGPAVERFIKEKGGALGADGINIACTAINRNPETVARVISDLFTMVDGKAFRTAGDAIVEAILDQKPPVVGWTASTVAKRTRRRLLGSPGARQWPRLTT